MEPTTKPARRIHAREIIATALGTEIEDVTRYQRVFWQECSGIFHVGPRAPEKDGWKLYPTQPTWLRLPEGRLVWIREE